MRIPMIWVHMMRIHMMWIYMTLWDHKCNDVGTFSSDWNHHVKLLSTILCWLCKHVFTINPLSVNGPSEKLTCLDNGFHHEVYTLENEHQCHTPHGSTLQCHRTVHVYWLRKLLSYMSPSCAHILKLLTDQFGLTTNFMDRQYPKAFVKCVCLWLQEHSLSWP